MATAETKPTTGAGRLPAGVSRKTFARWGGIVKFFDPVIKAFHLSTDGIDVMATTKGLHLRAKAGAVAAAANFNVTSNGTSTFSVSQGTFNSAVPGNLETNLTLGSGERWIYLKVIYSLTASASGFTYAATFTSCTIDASSASERTDPLGPSTGTFYILLAKFTNGVKDAQYVTRSIEAFLTGTGLSKAIMVVNQQ